MNRELRAAKLVEAASLSEADLRSYQAEELIPFMLENPKSAAYVGMGLGKTGSSLTVVDRLFWTGSVNKVLIVAPVRVAVQTWPTEMTLWKHLAWMQDAYSLIRHDPSDPRLLPVLKQARSEAREGFLETAEQAAGKARTAFYRQQRIEAATSDKPIHIVNREWLKELVQFFGKKWSYDCIIVDECTSFSDHKTDRWKALARVAALTPRVHLLSGTPAPEGIHQLFAQCYLLDRGERFGRSITRFRSEYMMQNPYTKKWTPQRGAVEAVTDKMANIAMVMKEEEYLPMDKPITIDRPILLDRDEMKAYKEFEASSILELPDDQFIEAVNAGVLSGKLLQFASGAVLDAEKKWHPVHDRKLEDLKDLIEQLHGEPLLIAYWFRSSLERLRKLLPKATVMDRQGACVDDWNKGKIPLLLLHPQSAGHGLNMQKGPGHDLSFFDTPSSLEMHLQLIKRIARPGQAKVVRVHYQTTQGTLDAAALPRLKGKEGAQDRIMHYLSSVRRRLRKPPVLIEGDDL